MKRLMPALLPGLLAVGLGSCATENADHAQPVRIATADEVRGATPLGQVYGTSSIAGFSRNQAYMRALHEVIDQSAAMGATDVVLVHTPRASFWTTTETIRGDAYRR